MKIKVQTSMEDPTMINEINAHKFNDNYTVQTVDEPINVFGVEHNKEEAEALARWIEGEKGIKVAVVYNSPDKVREARKLRPTPIRYAFRAEAFKDLGLWK